MSYKLKRLGVGVVAALALCLVLTSIAAAASFTASSYPASWVGQGNPSEYGQVTTEAGLLECTSASGSATLSEPSGTISISGSTPTGCKAFGFLSASVSTNGCTALVHVKEATGTDKYSATADLVCPAGQAIVTTAGTCELVVHPQTGNVTGELTNKTAEGTIQVDLKNQNVKYTVTKDGIGCPFSGTGEKTGTTVHQLKAGIVKLAGRTVDVG